MNTVIISLVLFPLFGPRTTRELLGFLTVWSLAKWQGQGKGKG